jgi:phytoene dehydrogenase-like protein
MHYDDIVVGAGHNGLTAAAYLARAGRRVLVLERSDHVGGAAVSARVFPGVDARLSRYSYRVSLLPRQLLAELDLDLRLVRRRFSSYTPVPGDPTRGLLVDTADREATRSSFVRATGSDRDFRAWQEFYGRIGRIAARVFPTVLDPLRPRSEVSGLAGDPDLWTALTERPLGQLLERTFEDDTVRGVVATDALIGTFADLHDPSLRQNICFLYHVMGGGTGDWDVPVGGMGAVTDALARAALTAGAVLRTGSPVKAVDPSSGTVEWEGGSATADWLYAGCAPAVLNDLLVAGGHRPVETEPGPEGSQLKVNLLLTRLPALRDPTVDPASAFVGTFHVNEGYAQLCEAYAGAAAGHVVARPPGEVYCHTLSDPSILGTDLAARGMQTLTLFGLHVPARLFEADPDRVRAQVLEATLDSLDAVLAEPVRELVARDAEGRPCLEVRSPLDLQHDVGLPGGNIFHRSLQWPWAEREAEVGTWGVETAYPRLLLAGAGARRGGGVSGIAGRSAALAALGAADLRA